MKIISKLKEYNVLFEKELNFLYEFFEIENAFFVVDKNVYNLYVAFFDKIPHDKLRVIESIEQNKNIDTALSICSSMTAMASKRNSVLVSIGGGIIQDITGFVANILYRGIKWIFVPTTLLSACDSCIGGKTSLNYKSYKNLLGTFYPPDLIHICPCFFNTLTDRDYKSGLGEVVKFNIMSGLYGLISITDDLPQLLTRDGKCIQKYVASSLEYKRAFIEQDEFDKGERIKLNFAHTFGHAIETVTDYGIPHGMAVAIGMIMANSVSLSRGLLPDTIVHNCEKVLLQIIDIDISLLQVPIENIINAIRKDKKQLSDNLTAVLLKSEVHGFTLNIVHDLQRKEVEYATKYFLELYSGF